MRATREFGHLLQWATLNDFGLKTGLTIPHIAIPGTVHGAGGFDRTQLRTSAADTGAGVVF